MAYSRATLLIAAAVIAVLVLLPETASAKTYRVGDDSGWDISVDYDAWASGKSFKVGDTLEFVYSEEHDVAVVDAQSYANCDVPDSAYTLVSGDDKVALSQAGTWYFICGAEGHCGSGMKLTINVQ